MEIQPLKAVRLLLILVVATMAPVLLSQSSNPTANPSRTTPPSDIPRTTRSPRISPANAASLRLRVLARIRGNAYQIDSTGDSHTATVLPVGVDRGVILIDLETGSESARCTAPYSSYAISASGRTVAGAIGPEIQFCDPLSPADLQSLQPSSVEVTCLRFAKDGALLASGHTDGTVRLWDVAKRALLWTSPPKGSPVAKLAVPADGKHVAAGYRDSSLKYWTVGGNGVRQAPLASAMSGGYLRMASFIANDRKIVLGLKDGTAIWDVTSNDLRRFPQGADAVSPDDRMAVTVGQYLGLGAQGYTPLVLWDLATGAEIATVNTARGMLAVSAAFTRDGTALLASTNAGEVLLWRP